MLNVALSPSQIGDELAATEAVAPHEVTIQLVSIIMVISSVQLVVPSSTVTL